METVRKKRPKNRRPQKRDAQAGRLKLETWDACWVAGGGVDNSGRPDSFESFWLASEPTDIYHPYLGGVFLKIFRMFNPIGKTIFQFGEAYFSIP